MCTWNNILQVRPSSLPPWSQLCYQLPPSTCSFWSTIVPGRFQFVRLRSSSSLCTFARLTFFVPTFAPISAYFVYRAAAGCSLHVLSGDVACRLIAACFVLRRLVLSRRPSLSPLSRTRVLPSRRFALVRRHVAWVFVYRLTSRSRRLPLVQPQTTCTDDASCHIKCKRLCFRYGRVSLSRRSDKYQTMSLVLY